MLTRVKYIIIIMISAITGMTVINIFGGTYVVAGNFVRRIR